jgi:hypothetical protein
MCARLNLLALLFLFAGIGAGLGESLPGIQAITIQGQGATKTRTFTVNDNWHIEAVANTPIKVTAVASDGTETVLVNYPGSTPALPRYGGMSAPVVNGGNFTLTVDAQGVWQVKIIETGFTANYWGDAPASTPIPMPNPVSAMPVTQDTAASVPIVTFTRKSDPTSEQPETTDEFRYTGWCSLKWKTDQSVKITMVMGDGSRETERQTIPGTGRVFPYMQHNGMSGQPSIPSSDTASNGPYVGGRTLQIPGSAHIIVAGEGNWTLTVYPMQMGGMRSGGAATSSGSTSNGVVAATPAATNAAPAQPPAPIPTMTDDQARAVVLIKGDNAEGTGFMIKTPNGPAVITNIHVIANNPNLKITTNTGALVDVLAEKGASDRDLAMLMIKDAGYSYLDFATDISQSVQPGDEVITPGNSQGGEVMLNTGGKVLGIGPVRIEFDNPIYHGNSGGPVFHPKSGKVLGVVTEGMKNEMTDELDKASFASRNSAISGAMRYFGLRLDTVDAWIPIDSRRFGIETTFLDQFHEQSRRLDAYLNRADRNQSNDSNNGGNNGSGSDNREAKIYLDDAKIMKADENYTGRVSGSDTAQRIDLLKSLLFDLQCVADLDMDQIKDKTNFYSFDQERAQEEYEYRKALRDELDSIGSDIERLGGLPRTNN